MQCPRELGTSTCTVHRRSALPCNTISRHIHAHAPFSIRFHDLKQGRETFLCARALACRSPHSSSSYRRPAAGSAARRTRPSCAAAAPTPSSAPWKAGFATSARAATAARTALYRRRRTSCSRHGLFVCVFEGPVCSQAVLSAASRCTLLQEVLRAPPRPPARRCSAAAAPPAALSSVM